MRSRTISILAAFVSLVTPECQADETVWAKPSDSVLAWADAKSYCESLIEDGVSEWRLPTVYEVMEVRDILVRDTHSSHRYSEDAYAWTCNPGPPSDYPEEFRPKVSVTHWQFNLDLGVVGEEFLQRARAVCVRGEPNPQCDHLTRSPWACVDVYLRPPQGESRPSHQWLAGIVIEGITSSGEVLELGTTNSVGVVCIRREKLKRDLVAVVGCHMGRCVASRGQGISTGSTTSLVFWIGKNRSRMGEKGKFCFQVRSWADESPISGIQFIAIMADGRVKHLGKAGRSGRFCVKSANRNDWNEYLFILACDGSICTGVSTSQFAAGQTTQLYLSRPIALDRPAS